jgi:hypothetical protein
VGSANASSCTLTNPGGSLTEGSEKTRLCKAFKAAVKRACRKGVNGKPSNKTPFNDLFYEDLAKIAKDEGGGVGAIAREVPSLVKDLGGKIGGGALAALESEGGVVAGGAGAAGVWNALGGATQGITGALTAVPGIAEDAVRGILWIGKLALGEGLKLRFLDGQMADGSVLEIKGPGDGFGEGQLKDLKTIGGGKEPKVLSCESCKAPCTNDAPYGSRAIGCG